ncbi:PaaI family thioesterase [Actinocorallia populi]|uniref:PaaI family thioesterase n=1 Tax=Actinocorallia populi TaxID=2079200 RepID=UPI000D089046|nr:PaaI family thioesterase [Actinocorallia populi]
MTASPATTPPPDAPVPEQRLEMLQPEDLLETGGYRGCFGCGEEHESGLRFQRTGTDGKAVYGRFTVTDLHQGSPGLAHGGLLATAMDEILGTAAWNLGRMAVTGRLETDYRLPVPVGSVVHLKAWCTGVDGRKIYLQGEGRIGSPDGPVAVQAAALFLEVPREHFFGER